MPHPLRSFNIPSGAQYGARRLSGRGHLGCDYHPKSNKDGDPIYATLEGGRIAAKGYGPSRVNGYGYWVKIAYPGGVETTSAHMREMCPFPVGTAVGPTSIVGYVGHTGNAVIADPPGSHVHHELRVNGVLRDPFAYYGGNATAGSSGVPIVASEPEPLRQDNNVKTVFAQPSKQYWTLGELSYKLHTSIEQANVDNQVFTKKGNAVFEEWGDQLVALEVGLIEQRRAQFADALALAVPKGGAATSSEQLSIDYDLLASKVADKLATRLIS
jgi:hypothetical protein